MPHSKMLIFFTLAICLFIPAVAAATPTAFLVVTINTDNSDSFGCTAQHCTLREAVVAANASTNVPDAILIPSSVGTITLTQGQLLVTDALTILGTGDRTTILANNASRHFEVAAGIPLTLENLRLEDGVADNGGAILNRGDLVLDNMEIYSNQAVKPGNFGDGGGIYNTGTGDLTLQNDTIVFSNLANFGGGIYNNGGTVTIRDSIISENFAQGNEMSNGGGIRNWLRGTVNIYNSEISLNSASLSGGGIHNAKISFLNNPLHNGDDSTINIEDTTFNQNSAQHGGGVWNSGTVGIRRSTFEANTMSAFGQGGGIHNSGFLYLINSTLFGNGSGFSGGGLYNEGTAQLGFATFSANSATAGASVQTGGGVTTFSGVFIGGDINGACNFVGTIGYVGNNIDVDGSCGDFTTEPNPMLAGYGHHGGATKTVALSSDSPLIDAGIEKACFGVDQRNLVRPVDGNDPDTVAECDIGAFEWGATASPTAVKLTGQRVKLASLNQFMIVLLLITTAFTLFYKSNSLAFVAAHLPSANRTSK